MSFLFSAQTITSRYDVFAKERWHDFICYSRICEKNFFTGYRNLNVEWNCDCYLNKEHIVPKTRIFKKGNDIVIDCDR